MSEINDVTKAEIERMLKDLEDEVNNQEIKDIKKLGIDEIAFQEYLKDRGQHFF